GRGARRTARREPGRGAPRTPRRGRAREAPIPGSTTRAYKRRRGETRRRSPAACDRAERGPSHRAGSEVLRAPRCTRASAASAGWLAGGRRSPLGLLQYVAGSAHGLQELRFEVGVDLPPEIVDVDVDDVGESIEADSPDMLRDERA